MKQRSRVVRKTRARCGFMKVASWNVRGLGAPSNRKLIKEFICKISLDVIFQDTKLLQVDRGMVKSLWSSKRIG